MYTSVWNDDAGLILETLEEVKASFPTAWNNAHNPKAAPLKRDREEFCQRACWALRAKGIPAAMNGKRGNAADLSEDILALPNIDENGQSHGGAQDTSGRYAAIEIRDIIAGAGPDANGNQAGSLVFGDVTQATIDQNTSGCYVEPDPAYRYAPEPGPEPGPEPEPPPTNGDFETTVLTMLATIAHRVAAIEEAQARGLVGLGAINTNVSDGRAETHALFDQQTKRIFGVDGSGAASVAQEAIDILTTLKPAQGEQGTLPKICRLR